MPNHYDKILRENFREPKAGLLQQLVPGAITSIQPIVPKLQRTLERETDTVAEVTTTDGTRLIVHIEWQSTNDPGMAARMALYDLLLNQTYKLDVVRAVLYLGNDPLRMNDTYTFSGFEYRCRMIDVRQLDPSTFLQSDDAGEVIFAVLAGSSQPEAKAVVIKQIFSKLQQLYATDTAGLQVKIRQLELLSLLRGENIQQLIAQEEQNMPVTIDITKDIRYKQGLAVGEEKIKQATEQATEQATGQTLTATAEKMFIKGLDISLVQDVTGLRRSLLEDIAVRIAATK